MFRAMNKSICLSVCQKVNDRSKNRSLFPNRGNRSIKLTTNRGIKHDCPFINIRKVPREVLKTEGEARGFQPSRGTLRMLMNDKIMFDRYYCINKAKHCENKDNIGALYFITSLHFSTRVSFLKPCMIRAQFRYSYFLCALRGAW